MNEYRSVLPTKDEMYVLSQGFFGSQGQIAAAWVNWALEYLAATGAGNPNYDRVATYTSPNLVSYYHYCMTLQAACQLYLQENSIEN